MRNRSDHRIPIACRCAPPKLSEHRSKSESIAQSLLNVRHRGHRNPDRKQNRATNRFPMCATVAIGTQIETRIDHSIAARRAPPWPWEPRPKAESSNQSLPDVRHRGHRNPIASRCAPPWRSEPRSKPESITQSLPDVRHRGHGNPDRKQNRATNRFPMCATAAIGTQTEARIDRPIASRSAPPWPSEPRSKPASIGQSLRKSIRNCFPMCATVDTDCQIEIKIDKNIICKIHRKSPTDVRHRYHRCPVRNQNRSANRMPTRTENRHRNRSKIDAKSTPEGSK